LQSAREEAQEHAKTLFQMLDDQDQIQLTAMKALFDILITFGPTLFDNGDEVSASIVPRLHDFLCHTDMELRATAVKGFTKLLFNNILVHSQVRNSYENTHIF
jgi:hypothetical protein